MFKVAKELAALNDNAIILSNEQRKSKLLSAIAKRWFSRQAQRVLTVIAPKNNEIKSLSIPLLLAGILMMLAGLAYFDLAPKSYRATALIKIVKRGYNDDNADVSGLKKQRDPYDPEMAPAEAQLIGSDVILDQVIKNLQLDTLWNKRPSPPPLTLIETRSQLRSKIDIRSKANSSIIRITVSSADRFETAIIANEIAKVYQAYRQNLGQAIIEDKFSAIRKLWDEANKKVELAQGRLDALSQNTNPTKIADNSLVYGSDRFVLLQQKQKELAKTLFEQQNQLDQFKAMDKKELLLLLASSDPNTNSVFNSAFGKLRVAEKELTQARIVHGDDSPEVKRSQLVVNNLDAQIARITDGILLMKQSSLPGIQAGLDQINAELLTVKTNGSPNAGDSQNPAYRTAVEELRTATAQRDVLQNQMNDKATLATAPIVIKPEILENAEIPTRPYLPDRTISIAAVVGGAGLMFLGLIVFLIGKRTKPATVKA